MLSPIRIDHCDLAAVFLFELNLTVIMGDQNRRKSGKDQLSLHIVVFSDQRDLINTVVRNTFLFVRKIALSDPILLLIPAGDAKSCACQRCRKTALPFLTV